MKPGMQPPNGQRRLPPRRTQAGRGRGRGLLIGAAALGALLAGLDTVLWVRAERALDRQLAGLVAAARAAGWDFEADGDSRGGWPDAATLTLRHPSLHGGARPLPGGIAWSGDGVMLSLPLLHPHRPTLLADGTQTVTMASALPGSPTVRFWGSGLSLRLPDRQGAMQDGLRLHADVLHVALAGAGPDDVAEAADLTARLRWRPSPTPGGAGQVALSLFLRDLALPVPGQGGEAAGGDRADRIVQQARLEATLIGRPGSPGSRLRIGRAEIDWGGSRVRFAGQASLRADGSPDGDFVLELADAGPALRRLRGAGFIDAGTEQAMAAVLGLIAAGEPGPALRLPLLLRDGMLRLGEIPLLRLPGLPPG